ncbi:MAG: hypothetical protein RRB13_16610 [bacterium]|nr:hypothetical protein [bacterium]
MHKHLLTCLFIAQLTTTAYAGSANLELSGISALASNQTQTAQGGKQIGFGYASQSGSLAYEDNSTGTSSASSAMFEYNQPMEKNLLVLGYSSGNSKQQFDQSGSIIAGGTTYQVTQSWEFSGPNNQIAGFYQVNLSEQNYLDLGLALVNETTEVTVQQDITDPSGTNVSSGTFVGSAANSYTSVSIKYSGSLKDDLRIAASLSPAVASSQAYSGDFTGNTSKAGHGQLVVIGVGFQGKDKTLGLDYKQRDKSESASSNGYTTLQLDGQYRISGAAILEGMASQSSYTAYSSGGQDIQVTQYRFGGYYALTGAVLGFFLDNGSASYSGTSAGDGISSEQLTTLSLVASKSF